MIKDYASLNSLTRRIPALFMVLGFLTLSCAKDDFIKEDNTLKSTIGIDSLILLNDVKEDSVWADIRSSKTFVINTPGSSPNIRGEEDMFIQISPDSFIEPLGRPISYPIYIEIDEIQGMSDLLTSGLDYVSSSGKRLSVQYGFRLTAFSSGFYLQPTKPLNLKVEADTFFNETVSLYAFYDQLWDHPPQHTYSLSDQKADGLYMFLENLGNGWFTVGRNLNTEDIDLSLELRGGNMKLDDRVALKVYILYPGLRAIDKLDVTEDIVELEVIPNERFNVLVLGYDYTRSSYVFGEKSFENGLSSNSNSTLIFESKEISEIHSFIRNAF